MTVSLAELKAPCQWKKLELEQLGQIRNCSLIPCQKAAKKASFLAKLQKILQNLDVITFKTLENNLNEGKNKCFCTVRVSLASLAIAHGLGICLIIALFSET